MAGEAKIRSPLVSASLAAEGDRLVLRLVGELDLVGRTIVDAACGIWDASNPVVELDLAGLSFLDCIGVLMEARGDRRQDRAVLAGSSALVEVATGTPS